MSPVSRNHVAAPKASALSDEVAGLASRRFDERRHTGGLR